MSDPYLQRNGTLKNRLGITDPHELAIVEDEISALRLHDIEPGPIAHPRSLKDLKTIHRFRKG
ncbi:MAG: hypothetical protein ABSA13_19325 [Beijerinckiaceae bacterium]|jgi:cell filamentation protein